MKVRKIETDELFEMKDLGGKVILSKGGVDTPISYKKFKSDYELVEDDYNMEVVLPKDFEADIARTRAEKIGKRLDRTSKKKNVSDKPKPSSSSKKTPTSTTKPKKTKSTESGLISLKDICDELSMEPSKARRILRKNNVTSPYEWNEKESLNIKKLLK